MGHFLVGRQQRTEHIGLADFLDARTLAGRMRDVVEQPLDQFARRRGIHTFLADLGEAADLAVDAAEQQLDRSAGIERAFADRLGNAGGDPEQASCFLARGHRRTQPVEHIAQAQRILRLRGIAEPLQQRRLEGQAQAQGLRAQFLQWQRFRQSLGAGRQGRGQIGRKQRRIGEQLLAAAGTQVVEQGQQDDRNVLVPGLHALEVIGQLDHAAHEHGIAFFALRHGVGQQGFGQPLHFLDNHRRAIQLDHAQGALRLMQVGRAEAHEAGVGRILDICLERLARLLQRVVKFALDPVQRGEVVVQFHDFHSPWRSPATLTLSYAAARKPYFAHRTATTAILREECSDPGVCPGHAGLQAALRTGRGVSCGIVEGVEWQTASPLIWYVTDSGLSPAA